MDLCNFIPQELVDVAILEEPEHLNWFRMLNRQEESNQGSGIDIDGQDDGGLAEETLTMISSPRQRPLGRAAYSVKR